MTVTKEMILETLRKVEDPELKRDIISLGMLRDIATDHGKIFIHLEITTPSEPLKSLLKQSVQEHVRKIPGVSDVTVQISTQASRRGPAFSNQSPVAGIRRVIAVASGKGGVGKTTVAVNLALAVAQRGYKVGLMDGDIYGPNVPLMLGAAENARPSVTQDEKMGPLELHGIKMISMGILVPPDQPMIWRGPMLHNAVSQFVQKVDWGTLDFLFVDLPPGTGDVQLSLVQVVPLTGAVIVTTPQEVALLDVRKGIAMFQKTAVPILGMIENMTGEIFGRGGGKKAAEQFRVPLLCEIPLDPRVREGGDAGMPIVVGAPSSPSARCFFKAADTLIEILAEKDQTAQRR